MLFRTIVDPRSAPRSSTWLATASLLLFALCLQLPASGGGAWAGVVPTPKDRQTVLPFSFVSPISSPIWSAGSTQAILWSGGDASWFVNLKLVDANTLVVVQTIVGSHSNSGGGYGWTIPPSTPGGFYRIYIEEVNQTQWQYSPTFRIDNATPSWALTWGAVKGLYR